MGDDGVALVVFVLFLLAMTVASTFDGETEREAVQVSAAVDFDEYIAEIKEDNAKN